MAVGQLLLDFNKVYYSSQKEFLYNILNRFGIPRKLRIYVNKNWYKWNLQLRPHVPAHFSVRWHIYIIHFKLLTVFIVFLKLAKGMYVTAA